MKPAHWRPTLGMLLLGFVPIAAGDDWPQHLGPHRNGISAETGLMKVWPAGGPREVWRVEGGVGMSGLAVDRGRLVTMLQRENEQLVVALDAKIGQPIWQSVIGKPYRNRMGHGPRATPTIVGDQVFAFSGEGHLIALQMNDGKIAWRVDAVAANEGKPADFGMACSPLVVGNDVIVTIGAPTATVVAYDRETGALNWQAGEGDTAGYSSPVLLDVGGMDQIVAFTGSSLLGLKSEGGKVLWRYPFKTDYECNIANPISSHGKLFFSSGENRGCVFLSVARRGEDFEIDEVWESLGPRSVMRNEWQTSILWEGHLYGFDNVGSAGPITHLTCIDISSGERRWRRSHFGKGNLIAADGKLWISTMDGEFVVVRATPEKFDELGRVEVIEETRQAPSLADGLLYLRDDRDIVCLDVRAAE